MQNILEVPHLLARMDYRDRRVEYIQVQQYKYIPRLHWLYFLTVYPLNLLDALLLDAYSGLEIQKQIVHRAAQRTTHVKLIPTMNSAHHSGICYYTGNHLSYHFAIKWNQDSDTEHYVTHRCVASGCRKWVRDPFAVCNYKSKRATTYPDCSATNHPCNTYGNYEECSEKWFVLLQKYVFIKFLYRFDYTLIPL